MDHENFYNFFNSEELVTDFLIVFENNFTPHTGLRHPRQPDPGFVEITDSTVWKTNVYYRVYFNDFIKSILACDILKHVIMNGMSGSSWRFRRYNIVCITVNSNEIRSVGK